MLNKLVMNVTALIQIPGYSYNEYLLILSPHEELRNKINYIKNFFAEKYRSAYAKFGQPHIPLLNFIQAEVAEERILKRFSTIGMGFHPIKIELKDFGSLPTHSIYIKVDSQLQIKNLVKELKAAQQLITINKDNKAHFIDAPNITIARKLLPWQYEKAWEEYCHLEFSGRFMADEMVLLKRRVGEKQYHPLKSFKFSCTPVKVEQGALFM